MRDCTYDELRHKEKVTKCVNVTWLTCWLLGMLLLYVGIALAALCQWWWLPFTIGTILVLVGGLFALIHEELTR